MKELLGVGGKTYTLELGVMQWADMISYPLVYNLSCFNPCVYGKDKKKQLVLEVVLI